MQAVVFDALVHGVYVVTTRLGDVVNGMTASWISQVSLKPLLVMVSIAPSRYSHDLIKQSGIFAVNVLDRDQADLGKRFGFKSGRQVDKFAGLEWTTGATGAPILPQAYACLELKLKETVPAGDHTLFVGEVVAAKVQHPQTQPLVFKKNDFF